MSFIDANPTEFPWAKEALRSFQESGLPTHKNEAWKYTSYQKFLSPYEKPFQGESIESDLSVFKDARVEQIIFVNGVPRFISDQVRVAEVDETALDFNDFSDYLSSEPFASYTLATSRHNYFISIGRPLDKPLEVIHLNTLKTSEHVGINLIYSAHPNVSLDILEKFESVPNAKGQLTVNTFVKAQENSIVRHYQLGRAQTATLAHTMAWVSQKAQYHHGFFHAKGDFFRGALEIRLEGHRAQTKSLGLYHLAEKGHFDAATKIAHNHYETFSEQLYKGILRDQSRGIFNGLIYVAKDSQKIQSKQLNKNLILSKGAQANSRPQLKIFADDVQCAHGSTTGELSDEELFYFLARGISKDRAKELLSKAFSNDVLLKIENPLLQKKISECYFD